MSKNYMNDSQASEIMKFISDTMKFPIMGAGGGFAPIGMYGWSPDYVTGAPQGWLRCEGQEVNIADYPELATFYASQHGASNYWGGDGITTFAVPDLRGEFIRGAGTNSHANQGDGGAVGEHQDGTTINNVASSSCLISIKNEDIKTSVQRSWMGTSDPSSGNQYDCAVRPTNTSGVFFVKATVSDAEINAFDVYTPREHQVAWWEEEIDGVWKRKPVYEKTVTDTLPGTLNQYKTIATLTDADNVIECITGILSYTSNIQLIPNPFIYYKFEVSSQAFSIGCNSSDILNKSIKATFRYTKTTDDWQTS